MKYYIETVKNFKTHLLQKKNMIMKIYVIKYQNKVYWIID